MVINESTLAKGHFRKPNALRKSIGDILGEEAFVKWMKEQAKVKPVAQSDPVAEKILELLKPLEKDKSIRLGNYGYVIKRSKGKDAKGFVVKKAMK